jgi:hypothetical protein
MTSSDETLQRYPRDEQQQQQQQQQQQHTGTPATELESHEHSRFPPTSAAPSSPASGAEVQRVFKHFKLRSSGLCTSTQVVAPYSQALP